MNNQNIKYIDNLNKDNETNNNVILLNNTLDKQIYPSDLTAENIFIQIENMSKDDMYDITIINEYLQQLEYIFNNIEQKNKLKELFKWKEIFLMIGYSKDCYVIEWIDNLY